jgi:hypothetical protein
VTLRLAVSLLALVSTPVVLGQAGRKTGATSMANVDSQRSYTPPRTPDGQPDISGMYNPGWIGQPAETPYAGEWKRPPSQANMGPTDFGAAAADDSDPTVAHIERTTKPFVVDPPDGKIPVQAWVLEMRKKFYKYRTEPEYLDPRVRCLQAGIPRSNTPVYYNSYQILQTPGYVIILYEWNHMTRVIPLDGRPHLDSRIHTAMGDSRGRWEGNTLLVDVTNFNDETWVLGHGEISEGQPGETSRTGHGTLHSTELHVVERWTPINKDIIRYEARIEDPKVFTRPFTIRFDPMARARPDHQLFEYACHEGNREGILLHTRGRIDIDPPQSKK